MRHQQHARRGPAPPAIAAWLRPTELLQWLRTSLWLLPAAMVLVSAAVAALLVHLHGRIPARPLSNWPAVFGAGAEGSRAMLTAIAGSMITVAGVVFSITLVTLSMASTQYSPRVLRNFLGDRWNQSVLGVFVSVFAYCLVVLRSIRGPGEGAFVPELAVFGAIVLAFVAIGFLIFFIHHVSTLIQPSAIVERIADETCRCLDGWSFDDETESDSGPAAGVAAALPTGVQWRAVCAPRRGYVVHIDYDRLERVAARLHCPVRVDRGAGEFASAGQPLVAIATSRELAETDRREALEAFAIGRQRTAELDPTFGVRQVVDVALKALSSGQGDPTTASTAIDYLAAVLVHAGRSCPEAVGDAKPRSARSGPRVQRRGATYADLVQTSFGEIRQAAQGNLAVLGALVGMLESLDAVVRGPGRARMLQRQAQALLDSVLASGMPPVDTDRLRRRIEPLIVSFGAASARSESDVRTRSAGPGARTA